MARLQNSTLPNTCVKTFGLKTATGMLRRHLFNSHLDAWVEGCDKLGIVITAEDAQSSIIEYRTHQSERTIPAKDGTQRVPFSNEVFVDAIVDFIVREDLVSTCYYSM